MEWSSPRSGVHDLPSVRVSTDRPRVQAYWSRDEPYRFVPVTEIAEAFRNSKVGKSNAAHLEQPFEETEISNEALITKRYALTRKAPSSCCSVLSMLGSFAPWK